MKKYLDFRGLSYFYNIINTAFAKKTETTNDFSNGTVGSVSNGLLPVITDPTRSYINVDVTNQMGTVSGTTRSLGLSIMVLNNAENYLLINNLDSTNSLSLVVSVVLHENDLITDVVMPANLSEIPAEQSLEISIIIREINNTKIAFITLSELLTTQTLNYLV